MNGSLPPGLLDQLMNNYSGRDLGDQLQMAKFRQASGGVASPVANQPVQSSSLAPPMRGDGRQMVNKGVQGTPADRSSATPMSSIIDKAAGEEVSAKANFEGVSPGQKPNTPMQGAPKALQGVRPKQKPMQQGNNPLLARILQMMQQQHIQRPSMGISP